MCVACVWSGWGRAWVWQPWGFDAAMSTASLPPKRPECVFFPLFYPHHHHVFASHACFCTLRTMGQSFTLSSCGCSSSQHTSSTEYVPATASRNRLIIPCEYDGVQRSCASWRESALWLWKRRQICSLCRSRIPLAVRHASA